MRKDTKTENTKKKSKKLADHDGEEPNFEDLDAEDTEVETEPEDLDPEILAALNVKKKKKAPAKDIDYIPELERGDFDLDSALPDDF
jgi:hypothetical protein